MVDIQKIVSEHCRSRVRGSQFGWLARSCDNAPRVSRGETFYNPARDDRGAKFRPIIDNAAVCSNLGPASV